jgi:hypothetical protein
VKETGIVRSISGEAGQHVRGAREGVDDFGYERDINATPIRTHARTPTSPFGNSQNVSTSGDDLKTAPPQFKPWETTVELKSGNAPLTLELPAKD